MLSFSDRYGYTIPTTAFITEQFPLDVANEICTAFDQLKDSLTAHGQYMELSYYLLDLHIWCDYLHRRKQDYPPYYSSLHLEILTSKLLDSNRQWYEQLNLLEFGLNFMHTYARKNRDGNVMALTAKLVERLNVRFEALRYGYRIIDYMITPIVDRIDVSCIEQAMKESRDNVCVHIENALALYAKRPDPDYRNSIKESISAVECLAREITGESTLDRAFPKLKTNGVQLNSQFEEGLKRLYYYTNDGKTGIRHALMEDTYTPTAADAQYMLVTCSAFVNLIRSKMMANS